MAAMMTVGDVTFRRLPDGGVSVAMVDAAGEPLEPQELSAEQWAALVKAMPPVKGDG